MLKDLDLTDRFHFSNMTSCVPELSPPCMIVRLRMKEKGLNQKRLIVASMHTNTSLFLIGGPHLDYKYKGLLGSRNFHIDMSSVCSSLSQAPKLAIHSFEPLAQGTYRLS